MGSVQSRLIGLFSINYDPPDARDAWGAKASGMTDIKVQAARKLLASGTLPQEVAHSLGVSVPTLYRWVPRFFTDVDHGKLIETVAFPGLYRQRRRRKLSLFRRALGEKQRKPLLHFP